MVEYRELINSNNIIEIDQILLALNQQGVDAKTQGVKGLEIGNVELLGIRGESVFVPEEQWELALDVLEKMGLSLEDKEEDRDIVNYIYWVLAGLLVGAVIYMIIITYFI